MPKYYCDKSVNNVPIGFPIILDEAAAAEFIGTHLTPWEIYEKRKAAEDEAKKQIELAERNAKNALKAAKSDAAKAKEAAEAAKKERQK